MRSLTILGITAIEGGFPHSEIRGSKVVRTSPRHIAAYHVLHRLSAPRHPPDTLIALDRSHYRCPSLLLPLGRGQSARPLPPSGEKGQGLDLKTSFASNTSGNGGQATFTAGYARCALDRQKPEGFWGPIATTGYVHSSRCQISASITEATDEAVLKGRELIAAIRPSGENHSREMVEPDGIEPTTSSLQS